MGDSRIEPYPPGSREAEESVLGAMLIDPDARFVVNLQPEDFVSERRGIIYKAMMALSDEPIDFVTLCDQLEKMEELDNVGGPAYITRLLTVVPTSVHAEYYAGIVYRDSVRRKAIKAAGAIAEKAYSCSDIDELNAFCDSQVLSIRQRRKGGLVSVATIANRFYNQVEDWGQNPLQPGQVRGLSTGLRDFDILTGGFRAGELYIFCGRPAAGKSATVFEIARRIAQGGKNALCFSLEMTSQAIIGRWASAVSGIERRKIELNRATEEEHSQFITALLGIESMGHLWIDDTPALSASEIRARAMSHAREHGVDFIVVDHCGKMKIEAVHGENTAKTEGRKSSKLKDLSKELGIPIALVAQINRGVESRSDKRPTMSDLRDSGEHEENADGVYGLYREEYYNPHTDAKNMLEILALKQREGPGGVAAQIYYEARLSRFNDAEIRSKPLGGRYDD